MMVTTKELRIQLGKIIAQAARGQEITVTYRGEPVAKIVSFQSDAERGEESSVFGMWKDHDSEQSVEEHVRNVRKGRQF